MAVFIPMALMQDASAGHDRGSHDLLCLSQEMEYTAQDLHSAYQRDLKQRHHWPACGDEKALYSEICDLDRRTGGLLKDLREGRPLCDIEDRYRIAAETLECVNNKARYEHLCSRTGQLLSQLNRQMGTFGEKLACMSRPPVRPRSQWEDTGRYSHNDRVPLHYEPDPEDYRREQTRDAVINLIGALIESANRR